MCLCELHCRQSPPAVEHGSSPRKLDHYDTYGTVWLTLTRDKQSGISILKLVWKLSFQYEGTSPCAGVRSPLTYYHETREHKQRLAGFSHSLSNAFPSWNYSG